MDGHEGMANKIVLPFSDENSAIVGEAAGDGQQITQVESTFFFLISHLFTCSLIFHGLRKKK
jgi:hypothetical protein